MTPFKIEVVFKGVKSTPILKSAVDRARQRWCDIIKGWKQGANGFGISKLTVHIVPMKNRAGAGGTAAFTDPKKLKRISKSAGPIAHLPKEATIEVDLHDVDALYSTSQLSDMFTHEMAHALGLGTVWRKKKLVDLTKPDNPVYIGKRGIQEYKSMARKNALVPVPLERRGDVYTRGSHWRQTVFPGEIMTGEVSREMWISKITVGALDDLGYEVDIHEADYYEPPR